MNIQDVIDETVKRFSRAETVAELLEIGVEVFSLSYVNTLQEKCWNVFRQHRRRLTQGAAEPKTVAVFDFPAIFFAAFAKVGADDAPTEAYARIQSISDNLQLEGPLLLAMDSETNWRKQLFEGYKINRSEKPAGFIESRQESLTYAQRQGANILMVENYESDDVMASVAFRCKLLNIPCVIITEDTDMLQCISKSVACYSPRCAEFRGEDWVKAKHGVTPRQIVDWLCIVGKDDAPSVSGLGEKGATDCLQKFGDVMSLFDSRSTLTDKKKAALEEYVYSGQYFVAKDLHTLRKNLKVDICYV